MLTFEQLMWIEVIWKQAKLAYKFQSLNVLGETTFKVTGRVRES